MSPASRAGSGKTSCDDFSIAREIPLNAKNVLQIGDHHHDLHITYKKLNPETNYVVKERIKDLQSINNANKKGIDCLILDNFLYSEENPIEYLTMISELVQEKCIILIIEENVQPWDKIQTIIEKNKKLEDKKKFIKNNININFKKEIIKIVNRSNLQLVEIKPKLVNLNIINQVLKNLDNVLSSLKINNEDFKESLTTSEFILKVQKNKNIKISIHAISRMEHGVSDVRIINPLLAINSLQGYEISLSRISATGEFIYPSNQLPKIVIWQRPIHDYSEDRINLLKRMIKDGYIIITEFDDHPSNWPIIEKNKYLTFKACHAVQVSTSKLRDLIKNYNPEVALFPNSIYQIDDKIKATNDRKLRIFYGGYNRKKDWLIWINTINKLFLENPTEWEIEVIHDKDFFDSIELPINQKSFTPTCNYKTYRNKMSGCDIAFMPLRNTDFNNYKSDLKAIEAGSLGLLILATQTVYSEKFINGKNCLIFNTEKELYNQLEKCRLDHSIIDQIGNSAKIYIKKERLLLHQINARDQWYKKLIKRKEMLTEEIFKREPLLNIK